MSRTKLVMIQCDCCGTLSYYKPGNVDRQARSKGWIITADRKDFCGRICLEKRKIAGEKK